MDVISYRGPGAAGGVSSGLATLWRSQKKPRANWWFLSGGVLSTLNPGSTAAAFVMQIPDSVVKGHYRYCNEFLWPLLHDLPQYVTYNPEDRILYQSLNNTFAQYIAFEPSQSNFFVQDYQMALLPKLLRIHGLRASVFWHIPWPKKVAAKYVEPLVEIARGLLSAEIIGFHTDEYVSNFMQFVASHMPEFEVDCDGRTVRACSMIAEKRLLEVGPTDSYILRPYVHVPLRYAPMCTTLISHPLAINVREWEQLADNQRISSVAEKVDREIFHRPFILSVDRADYTKAVFDRLTAIDKFFELKPKMREEISFVQVCGRSRPGLSAFDRYWHSCQELYSYVNSRWQTESWQPVRWIESPLSAADLTVLYRCAHAMLVNPIRDGLNLTAKEFVACQKDNPGVLLLSEGAGVWHEIGQYSLPANPNNHQQVVDSLERALTMNPSERSSRNQLAKRQLESLTLAEWWKCFSKLPRKTAVRQPSEPAVKIA